jgi:hypothetical protein
MSEMDSVKLLKLIRKVALNTRISPFDIKNEWILLKQNSREIGSSGLAEYILKFESKLDLIKGSAAEVTSDEEKLNVLINGLNHDRYQELIARYKTKEITFKKNQIKI